MYKHTHTLFLGLKKTNKLILVRNFCSHCKGLYLKFGETSTVYLVLNGGLLFLGPQFSTINPIVVVNIIEVA